MSQDLPAGTTIRNLTTAGTFMTAGVQYNVDGHLGLQQVLVVIDGDPPPAVRRSGTPVS